MLLSEVNNIWDCILFFWVWFVAKISAIEQSDLIHHLIFINNFTNSVNDPI